MVTTIRVGGILDRMNWAKLVMRSITDDPSRVIIIECHDLVNPTI